MSLALRDVRTPFSSQIKHQFPYRCIFLRSHWRDTSTTKLKPAVTCVRASSARSLLLPPKWKAPTGGVILLVQKDFCFKTKNLNFTWSYYFYRHGRKRNKRKMLFISLWTTIKAQNFTQWTSWSSRRVQFAAAEFPFSIPGLLLLLWAKSCQITISSRLGKLIFTAHPLFPCKNKNHSEKVAIWRWHAKRV